MLSQKTIFPSFSDFFKKNVVLLVVVGYLAVACGERDCSKIDLSKLSDIKLPVKIETQAATMDEFAAELDQYLHRDFRLIMRCRTETDFDRERVLPGVMLWISDSWKVRNDSSKLGTLFKEKGITE